MTQPNDTPMDRLEFHRHGLALFPKNGDPQGGVALFVGDGKQLESKRFCNCAAARLKTCPHQLEISRIARILFRPDGRLGLYEDFREDFRYALAGILVTGDKETPDTVLIRHEETPHGPEIRALNAKGKELALFRPGAAAARLLERLSNGSSREKGFHRGAVLKRLALLTLSENERVMSLRGFRSRMQGLEESFWYRVAYHFFLEYGHGGLNFQMEVLPSSGEIVVSAQDAENSLVLRLQPPRETVRPLLEWFQRYHSGTSFPSLHPFPLRPVFKVRFTDKQDLMVVPLLELPGSDGSSPVYFSKDILESARYGDFVYLEDQGVFARIDPLAGEYKARWTETMVVKRERVPLFLDQFKKTMASGPYLLDEAVASRKIFKSYSRSLISPEAIDRDWCWLAVDYGFGNATLSLAEILKAKKRHQRFIETPEGWVDVESPELEGFDTLLDLQGAEGGGAAYGRLKLSRRDVFRVHAVHDSPPEIAEEKSRSEVLRQLLNLEATRPFPPAVGMTSQLRSYQQRGVEWSWFLYDNRFGGILCDDMGLGKTHQAMALMLSISADASPETPFLVVCPTTVLSHWLQKLTAYAPSLKVSVYHGTGRDFDQALSDSQVILTSYGLLRRDIARLSEVVYPLVIFDEIQHLKNAGTQGYTAAEAVRAAVKLGLTGTPIENSLTDLKALMDLTLPGYLGHDKTFKTRYVTPLRSDPDSPRQQELRRLISPFIMRRLKQSVLPELPDKIEDVRFCSLRGEQVKLYRDAVDSQGGNLLSMLKDETAKVPFIHIFALLSLLKQICDHPALLQESVETYEQHQSGKWDLFKELLDEVLDSGQKVVVYSQYLGMIRIIGKHLEARHVGYVALTGSSRNRGDIISKFNTDPDCRVYVGSLKAGGTGVDLVAGSVVIHYDRWWNAAKEDQATDRVHRIGQTRGVQVFKLVTQGTLEEKISAIIEKKRNLMDAVIKEGEPGFQGSFSRQELIDLLSIPVGEDEDEELIVEE